MDVLLREPFVKTNSSALAGNRNFAALAVAHGSIRPISLAAAPRPAVLAVSDCESSCSSWSTNVDQCYDDAACFCSITLDVGVTYVLRLLSV